MQLSGLLYPAIGPLSSICVPAEPLPQEVLAIVCSFHSIDEGETTVRLLNQKLQVVHRTDSSFYALGPRRALCLACIHLPLNLGCLLVTFDRSSHLPVVSSAVEKVARHLIPI